MIVIHTYTTFAAIAKKLEEEEKLKAQAQELKRGALAISQAVLFVKQHSVNCIAAALYGITCFSPELFPPAEAEAFTELLFSPPPDASGIPPDCRVHPSASPMTKLPEADQAEIKSHILNLYRRFLSEKEGAEFWGKPLLNFLAPMPRVR
jgi:hypothetical protein